MVQGTGRESTEAKPVEELTQAEAALEVALLVEEMRVALSHANCVRGSCVGSDLVSAHKQLDCQGRGWVPAEDLAVLLAAMSGVHGVRVSILVGDDWAFVSSFTKSHAGLKRVHKYEGTRDLTKHAFRAAAAALRTSK